MSSSLRVLLLGAGINGGAGQYSAQLANGLESHVDTHALLPNHASTEFETLLDPSVTVHKFSKPSSDTAMPSRANLPIEILERLKVLGTVVKMIRDMEVDIIHMPFYTTGPLRAYLLPILKTLRVPVVGTVHDPMSHTGQEVLQFGVDINEKGRMIGAYLLDRTIVHGPKTKEQAVKVGYPRSRLRTVPHGIYTHFPLGDHTVNPNQLLVFGNIRENKGYDRLPSIMDKIADHCPEASAVVAGDISHSADEDWVDETLADLREHEHITVDQGYISMDQTAKYFGESAAVLLPYYDASTSGVQMAAYRYQVPCIASDVGDLGYFIKEDGTGLVAAPSSDKDFADKTIQLLTDPDTRKDIEQNLGTVSEDYSWEKIAKQTVGVYREIL